MKEGWNDLIEGYLSENLSDKDLTIFNHNYKTSKEFKDTFIKRKKLWEGIQYANYLKAKEKVLAIKNQLESEKETPIITISSKKNRYRSLQFISGIAASILFLVLGYWHFQSSHEESISKTTQEIADRENALNQLDDLVGDAGTLDIIISKRLPLKTPEEETDKTIQLLVKKLEDDKLIYKFQNDTLTVYANPNLELSGEKIIYFKENLKNDTHYLKIKNDLYQFEETITQRTLNLVKDTKITELFNQ